VLHAGQAFIANQRRWSIPEIGITLWYYLLFQRDKNFFSGDANVTGADRTTADGERSSASRHVEFRNGWLTDTGMQRLPEPVSDGLRRRFGVQMFSLTECAEIAGDAKGNPLGRFPGWAVFVSSSI